MSAVTIIIIIIIVILITVIIIIIIINLSLPFVIWGFILWLLLYDDVENDCFEK